MEDGRSGTPRPPRRVPAGAGTLTQLETPSRSGGATPPPRGPWIFGRVLAGLLVLIVIVAAGAGAGWFIRQESLRLNTDEVLKSVGPSVVRVLASTCAGTGEASGVLIDNGRILTATSAIEEPRSIVVLMPDGRIRRANLLGTSTDGVAVLQSIGFDGAPVHLATANPEPKAERALIGYTAAGKQVINAIGSAADPTALGEVMNAAKLGGPVVDKSGGLVGLVVGDSVQASTIVGLDKLRGYVAPSPAGLTVGAGGICPQSHGPQAAIAPVLQVANTPLAVEVQKLLASYLTLENRQDFAALRPLYSPRFARGLSEEQDRAKHQTSYFFSPKLTDLAADGSYARMSYNVLFAATATGADGQNCSRLDTKFELVRSKGKLVIDRTSPMSPAIPCDS